MALILRSTKGQKLTISELDANFTYLESISGGSASTGATGPQGPTGPQGATGPSGSIIFPYSGTASFTGPFIISNNGITFSSSELQINNASRAYLDPPGVWATASFLGDFIGSVVSDGTASFYGGVVSNGTYDLGLASVPFNGNVDYLIGNSFSIGGGFLNGNGYQWQIYGSFETGIGIESYAINLFENNQEPYIEFYKRKASGENLSLNINHDNEGILILSELSDNNSSIFDVRNNQFDSVFELTHEEVRFGSSASIIVAGATGFSGTYSTGAGQVVTVTNGIITDVSIIFSSNKS